MDSQVMVALMLSLVGGASTSLGMHIFDWSFCGYAIFFITNGYLCHVVIVKAICVSVFVRFLPACWIDLFFDPVCSRDLRCAQSRELGTWI
jgi:hypothetical protein